MISALSNLGHLKFMVVDGRINSAVFIVFLKRMIKYKRNKIFLIVDNISFHKTKKVSEWIKANRDRIELFYLPRYSPELNPDEYLNQDLKTNAVYPPFFKTVITTISRTRGTRLVCQSHPSCPLSTEYQMTLSDRPMRCLRIEPDKSIFSGGSL
jgi:transposase